MSSASSSASDLTSSASSSASDSTPSASSSASDLTPSASSSASNLTSSEGSCASGGSGVESKELQYQQPSAPVDPTATSSMGAYGSTYTTDADGQLHQVHPGH